MNIFVSDRDPYLSAKNLDDKRVIKMILESAQLFSTALRLNGIDFGYKITHQNHPCAIWTRESRDNYLWLIDHMYYLGQVYKNAYDKEHKSLSLINDFKKYINIFPNIGLTDFNNCTTLFKDEKDTIVAYQKYLNHKWNNDKRSPTWKNRKVPDFFVGVKL